MIKFTFSSCRVAALSREAHLLLTATAYCLLLSACQPSLVAEFQDRPVVESYLYAGEPVRVSVAKLLPFRNDVYFSDEDINRLDIVINDETAGGVYPLTSQGGDGIYTGGAFLPEAGHAYRLQFMYDGVQVTAATQIAPLPENAQCSKTTITAGFRGGGGGGMTMPDPLEITWDNPSGDYYVVVAVCDTSSAYTPIYDFDDDDDDNDDNDDAFVAPLSFQSEITQGASVQLSPQSFSYSGYYTVKLCRVQPEYVLLYQRMNNRSENLAELNVNVVNGYGIFTGVSSTNFRVHVLSN